MIQWLSDPKALAVLSTAFVFVGAIVFLAAFVIVWPIRRNLFLIAALVVSSSLLGTFVVFSPVFSRRIITSLMFPPQNDFQNSDRIIFDSFGQQLIAALFQNPDSVAITIVVGAFLFSFSAAIWGLFFWNAGRRSEKTEISAVVENASCPDSHAKTRVN